jgi:hypothetical protein
MPLHYHLAGGTLRFPLTRNRSIGIGEPNASDDGVSAWKVAVAA